ncbi:MAG: FAD-dependent monooxygenase [Streptosporangiaceae bacterium]
MDRPHERFPLGGDDDLCAISPTPEAWCDQDQLEPLVRARAEELGVDIRFGTELVDFEHDADEVRATCRDRATGRQYSVHASRWRAEACTCGTWDAGVSACRTTPSAASDWKISPRIASPG